MIVLMPVAAKKAIIFAPGIRKRAKAPIFTPRVKR
jgi:hypothetical protein